MGPRGRALDLGITVATDGNALPSAAGWDGLDLAHNLASLLESKQVSDIVVLDIRAQTAIADYFLIGTVLNDRHARAVEEDVLTQFSREKKIRPQGIEGRPADGSGWHLLDYGDVVLHLFTAESRAHYDLEALWRDAKVVLKLL